MSRRAPTEGHLWQVDVVRLLTFTAVIAVHSLAFTEQPGNRVAAGAMMLLQFGREIFFAISAFVLVYSARDRPLDLGRFWRRRYLYVVVPYVVWTLVYEAYASLGPLHRAWSLDVLGRDLLYGGAMYHLYFLLVTMQLYLVFPLVLAFVRRTAHRAGRVLIVVGAVNVAWLAVTQWVPAPAGPAAWLWMHAYEILPTYAIYVLAGCYAAVHLRRLQALVQDHARALAVAAVASVAGALAAYAAQLAWMAPRNADSVLQPAMLLSCAAAVILLYLLGSHWAGGPRRRSATIATLSDASFGVYLAHPLVLQLLLDHGLGNNGQRLPAPAATLLGLVAAIAGGLALTLVARRTPLSLALTGRPWQRSPRDVGTPAPASPTFATVGASLATDRPRMGSGQAAFSPVPPAAVQRSLSHSVAPVYRLGDPSDDSQLAPKCFRYGYD
jgi:peptidoglycan/LPS O-acetylase OafA/YrhL